MSSIIQASAIPEMERYEVNPVTECWLWLGYTNKDGYARLGTENAHRVFYRTHIGTIEPGHDIDHLCKRRNCVNPEHLESVPEVENIRRKSRTVTYAGRRFDICRRGHPMEGANVLVTKRGDGTRRSCRQCNRDSVRARAKPIAA